MNEHLTYSNSPEPTPDAVQTTDGLSVSREVLLQPSETESPEATLHEPPPQTHPEGERLSSYDISSQLEGIKREYEVRIDTAMTLGLPAEAVARISAARDEALRRREQEWSEAIRLAENLIIDALINGTAQEDLPSAQLERTFEALRYLIERQTSDGNRYAVTQRLVYGCDRVNHNISVRYQPD